MARPPTSIDALAPPAPATYQDAIAPQQPHDDLSFEELAKRYNFRMTSDRRRVFSRLVIKECESRTAPVRVLDVGCGRGIGRRPEYQWAIRQHAGELWGLDPDETVSPPAGLFDQHQCATMDAAELPPDYFDVAYSYMVMEHVSEPDVFMTAVARCLKPGGLYLFVTPNKRHYFTRTASMLNAIGLDEFVLRLIKRQEVDEYHYPVKYRFNDERRIDACAGRLGLAPPEYVYLESRGPDGYLRGPLRPIFHLLALKRKLVRRRRSLVSLVCRMGKPPRKLAGSSRRFGKSCRS